MCIFISVWELWVGYANLKNTIQSTIEYKMLHLLKEILCLQKAKKPQRLLPKLPLISAETKSSARISMSDLYNHLRMSKCRWLCSWRSYIKMVHWLSMTTGCWWVHLGQTDYSYTTDKSQNPTNHFRQMRGKAQIGTGKQIHYIYIFVCIKIFILCLSLLPQSGS